MDMAEEHDDRDDQEEIEAGGEEEPSPDDGNVDVAENPTADDWTLEDEEDEDGEEHAGPPRMMLSTRNAAVAGVLRVHFEARDVDFVLDGDAAMRFLQMYRERREGALGDFLDARVSRAQDAWIVLDVREPLAATWIPGLPREKARTAIDPAVPA